jgi:hypothetical protein
VPVLERGNLGALIRAIEGSPNAHVKHVAWRLARENHASNPRLAQIQRPMGSRVLALYERARAAKTTEERKALLDTFTQATDSCTRPAIIAAATEQQPATYVADALAHDQPEELVGVAEGEEPRGAAATGHPVSAGIVDDQQIDAARLPRSWWRDRYPRLHQ